MGRSNKMAQLISHFHKLATNQSPPAVQSDPLIEEFPAPPAPPTPSAEVLDFPRAESPTLSAIPVEQPYPEPIADVILVPETPIEWKEVMEEVKGLYLKGQYKQCSARSKQILDDIHDPYRIHPIRLIYICFLAASSLELTARSLHNSSSTKLPLFQESISYFKKAQSYMALANVTTEPQIVRAAQPRHHRSNSSISSSIRSSVDSIFSQSSVSSVDSLVESPISPFDSEREKELIRFASASSTTDIINPQPLRRKKKVSFSSHLPTMESEPDLSSDDILDRFPSPPTHDTLSPTILPSSLDSRMIPLRLTDTVPRRQSYPLATTTATATPMPSQPDRSPETLTSVASINRYRHKLSSFDSRLDHHIANIQIQIQTLMSLRRARRSNLPNLFIITSSLPNNVTPTPTTSTPKPTLVKTQSDTRDSQPAPSSSLQERIKRLKESGWQRKRFEGEKYKSLCESVLYEIEMGGDL